MKREQRILERIDGDVVDLLQLNKKIIEYQRDEIKKGRNSTVYFDGDECAIVAIDLDGKSKGTRQDYER